MIVLITSNLQHTDTDALEGDRAKIIYLEVIYMTVYIISEIMPILRRLRHSTNSAPTESEVWLVTHYPRPGCQK
jgi:hypothetical protein